MKEFLQPEPIKAKITDLSGQAHELTARVITQENAKEMEEIVSRPENRSISLYLQLSFIFEKDNVFWSNFDVRTLRKLLNYFNEELINPS